MFDPFTLALMGGAVGGLLNKKDPLTGALMGAAGGYGAGALGGAGGLLGGTAPSGAAYTGTAAELAADGLGGVAMTPTPFESAIGGAQGFMKEAKPFMEAGSLGMQVANATKGQPQMPITPSPITPPTFNNAAGQMVASMQQQQAERMAMEKQNRLQRRQMRGGLI